MPWCPKCRNEYLETAKRCADCGVGLVADLAAHDRAESQAEEAQVLRILGPGGFLASLETYFGQNQIPARRGEEVLEVPLALAERIESILMQTVEFEREGSTLRLLGARSDQEPRYELDPSLFKQSVAELAADPAASLPRLASALAVGNGRQKAFALQALRDMEAAGSTRMGDFMVALARSGFRKPLFSLATLLADAPQAGVAAYVAQHLATLPKPALELALHVLARIGDRSVARAVAPLLEHEDPDVRAEADEVLMFVSGRDLGFDAEADERSRSSIVKLWREWIERDAAG